MMSSVIRVVGAAPSGLEIVGLAPAFAETVGNPELVLDSVLVATVDPPHAVSESALVITITETRNFFMGIPYRVLTIYQLLVGACNGLSIQQNSPLTSSLSGEISLKTKSRAFFGSSPPVCSTQSTQFL